MDRLEHNLRIVRERIAAAARAAGRDPAEVRLLAVSKTWPAADVAALAALGQREFAENRVQELTGKAAELAAAPGVPDLRWHLVGQLQRNKAGAVARIGAVVHSVDRRPLSPPSIGPPSRSPSGSTCSSRWTSAVRPAATVPAEERRRRTCRPWPTPSRRRRACGWWG